MTILAHTIFGSSDPASPTAFLIHGILGSRKNWASTARRLVERYPHWRCVTIDLRGHGESDGKSGPHTVRACARDLQELASHLGFQPSCVIGHSFGGKVALAYGALKPAGLKTVWSLDSDPGLTTSETISGVSQVLDGIRSAPVPVPHRLAIRNHFDNMGFDAGIGAWMTTNLKSSSEGYVWTLDLPVVEAMLSDYRALSLWPWIDDPSRDVFVRMVLAGKTSWWRGQAEDRLKSASNVSTQILPEAGHWVHIDDLEGLLQAFEVTFSSAD